MNKVPRFVGNELSLLIKDILNDNKLTCEMAAEAFKCNVQIIKEIINMDTAFKLKHYEVCSKITGYDLKYILSDIELEFENNVGLNHIVEFFSEISVLKRLNY